MPTIRLVEEHEASEQVKTVYDDVKREMGIDFVPQAIKAMAHNPDQLAHEWNSFKETASKWGKETMALVSLAVDTVLNCGYNINWDTAMLKQLGYTDQKIQEFVSLVSHTALYSHYCNGLQLEPDVLPEAAKGRKAA
ncbi:MAG: hypothetical protein M1548_07735 [Actinobacteria bacterium]|nr:hypothetical protein [Actinomycetota bacterium]